MDNGRRKHTTYRNPQLGLRSSIYITIRTISTGVLSTFDLLPSPPLILETKHPSPWMHKRKIAAADTCHQEFPRQKTLSALSQPWNLYAFSQQYCLSLWITTSGLNGIPSEYLLCGSASIRFVFTIYVIGERKQHEQRTCDFWTVSPIIHRFPLLPSFNRENFSAWT